MMYTKRFGTYGMLVGAALPAKIGETLSPSEITVQGGEVQGP
jgi:hypothetical protein